MNRKLIAERLRALAADDKNRSKAARLRDVVEDVEAALAAGVPHAAVVEELGRHGLEMTVATFETTLKRIRQKRASPAATRARTTAAASTADPAERATSMEAGSHDPTELDKIFTSKPDLAALAKLAKRSKR